jgi:alpha-tubulin suppressor-like RCC1 family protein
MIRSGAHKLSLPANVQIVQAVAGANHTVLRTLDGRLITFGSYKAGQLGRKRLAMPADDSTTTNSSVCFNLWD